MSNKIKEKTIAEHIKESQLPEGVRSSLLDLSLLQGNSPVFVKLANELILFAVIAKESEIKAAAYDCLEETFSKFQNDLKKMVEDYKSATR
jgi:hypothetical protein